MKRNQTASLILPMHGLRARLMLQLVQIAYSVYRRFYKRGKRAWQQSRAELRRRPAGSLGRSLAAFLDAGGFELMPRFEDHDVFHVLLGYGPDLPAEACLQYCLLGNGKRSVNVYGTVLLAALVFPEHWGAFRRAYERGRRARPFTHWDFEYLLNEPVVRLRSLIFQNTPDDEAFSLDF